MAFNFDTFVKDQKQSAIDVVDTITPGQIKEIGAAYKEGLAIGSPKQVINETLEQFTGIDLGIGTGMEGLGGKVKEFMKSQAADLTMQLEQQILGCINTQIRDLMNKVPAIDFILNFEDKINGILGNFRNKLEFKIDAELRKIAYNKIKIHQVALLKQRIRASIKDICPGATPASVAEVQDFNNKVKGFINKRTATGKDVLNKAKTLPESQIPFKGAMKSSNPTPVEGPSAAFIKENRESAKVRQKTSETLAAKVAPEVKGTSEDMVNEVSKDDETIPELVETVPKEEKKIEKKFRYYDVFKINLPSSSNYKNFGTDESTKHKDYTKMYFDYEQAISKILKPVKAEMTTHASEGIFDPAGKHDTDRMDPHGLVGQTGYAFIESVISNMNTTAETDAGGIVTVTLHGYIYIHQVQPGRGIGDSTIYLPGIIGNYAPGSTRAYDVTFDDACRKCIDIFIKNGIEKLTTEMAGLALSDPEDGII